MNLTRWERWGATSGLLASLNTFLMRAETGAGRLSTVAFGAGLAWITTYLAVQAPQIALARADGELEPQLAVVVNDIGLALATIADVPVAVLLVAVAVLSWRVKVFPEWVVWLSPVATAVHLMAWFGIILGSGPLAPGGLATFVVYPVFVVWLLSITILMIVRIGQPAYVHHGGGR